MISTLVLSLLTYLALGYSSSLRKRRLIVASIVLALILLFSQVSNLSGDSIRYHRVYQILVESNPFAFDVIDNSISSIGYANTSKDGIAFIASLVSLIFQDSSQTAYISSLFFISIIIVIYIDKCLNPINEKPVFNSLLLILNPVTLYFNLRGLREAIALLSFFAIYAFMNRLLIRNASAYLLATTFFGIKIQSVFFFYIFSFLLIITKFYFYLFVIPLAAQLLLFSSNTIAIKISKFDIIFKDAKYLLNSLLLILSYILIYLFLLLPIARNSVGQPVLDLYEDPIGFFLAIRYTDLLYSMQNFRFFSIGGIFINSLIIISFLYSLTLAFSLNRKINTLCKNTTLIRFFLLSTYFNSFRTLLFLSVISIPFAFLVTDVSSIGNRFLVLPIFIMSSVFLFPDALPVLYLSAKSINSKFSACRSF